MLILLREIRPPSPTHIQTSWSDWCSNWKHNAPQCDPVRHSRLWLQIALAMYFGYWLLGVTHPCSAILAPKQFAYGKITPTSNTHFSNA